MNITTIAGCLAVAILLSGCGKESAETATSSAVGAAEQATSETAQVAAEAAPPAAVSAEPMPDQARDTAADAMQAVGDDASEAALRERAKQAIDEAVQENRDAVGEMIKESTSDALQR